MGNRLTLTVSRPPGWACLGVTAALLLGGCGRGEVKVYRVAKDQPETPPTASPDSLPPGHPEIGASVQPPLSYQTPAGWSQGPPGEMRVASFSILGNDGKKADVSVIPLQGNAGGDFANVNRWRGQVGLQPIPELDLKALSQTVTMGGQPAELYDIAGNSTDSGAPTRILGAIQHRDGMVWFVKMTGDAALVEQQKPAFAGFLESMRIATAAAAELPPSHPPIDDMGAMSAAGLASAGAGQPVWNVPPGWQSVAAGQFLAAKFVVAGSDGEEAAVNVSNSEGEGGGLVNNVNRWRRQLGLDELSEADVNRLVTTADVPGGKTLLVDMSGTDARTGQPTRLVGAMVSVGSRTWFYKLMGNDKLVAREKTAFTNFVETAKY
jgi:hypothetical protein